MIELNQLLSTLRRWAWLLVLCLAAGLVTGYVFSSLQTPVYEASTKLLVSNQLQGKGSDFAGLTNQQLVSIYVQMLKTKQLRDAASKKIDVDIAGSQVSVQQVSDTQIIEVRIENSDPEKAARIANTMAQTLIEEIKALQLEQFSASENNLTVQVEQMKEKIAGLQGDYNKAYQQAYGQLYQNQLAQVNQQIADIQSELSTLQIDIVKLTNIWTVEGRSQLADKQARVAQLQASFKVYDDIRANLLVSRKPMQASSVTDDVQLQLMRSTIDVYQKTYLGLLTNLETARSNRLQQTPNAVQIQEAFAPSEPARPIPSTYTLLGGTAGLMLAVAAVFLMESLKIAFPSDNPILRKLGKVTPPSNLANKTR